MIDVVDDASKPIVTTIVGSKGMMITEEHEWNNDEKIDIRKRAIEKVFPRVRCVRVALMTVCVSSSKQLTLILPNTVPWILG